MDHHDHGAGQGLVSMIAGAIAGMNEHWIMLPADAIKVQLH